MHTGSVTLAASFALALAVAPASAVQSNEVILQPGDGIRLEFIPERGALPDSTWGARVYDVDGEGVTLLPMAGLISVVGRPFRTIREEVEQAFAREFVDGVVRLTPLLRLAVLGEVRTPGLVSADPTMTLADVLAAAGGLTESADRDDVRLVRAGERDRVQSADEVAADRTPLQSGDRIVVGRQSWAAENMPFLLGAGASVLAAIVTSVLVR
jgi:protein involved in polysaccharide export with SLBB domain